ncbi:TPR-like protein [Imleria badia]|nr:TPR-like protein [Imleria badia]
MPLVREWAKATLAGGTWKDALFASVKFPVPKFTLYRVICERLETTDHVTDAIECMQQMENELANETDIHDERAKWIHAFIRRCAEKLGRLGDAAVDARQHDTAITRYSAALSLDPTIGRSIYMKRSKVYVANGLWEEALDDTDQVMTLDPSSPWNFEKVLMEWAKVELTNGSWRNALKNAASFKVPILSIYRPLCEFLEKIDRVTDAFECWQQMTNESAEERDMQAKWVLDFKQRCAERLRRLGHAAVYAQQHKDAVTHYSAALSLNPAAPQDIFTQRSKVYVAMGLWEEALDDSTRVCRFCLV